ncbi:hypothetical protein AB0P16_14715 [Dietzia maris]|uniref:hypothetical protein n=1 Tax=Dietzia maris TaxID=37915 RepID=UPI003434899A
MFPIQNILAAIIERAASGKEQVIDAATTDDASMLGRLRWTMRARGAALTRAAEEFAEWSSGAGFGLEEAVDAVRNAFKILG